MTMLRLRQGFGLLLLSTGCMLASGIVTGQVAASPAAGQTAAPQNRSTEPDGNVVRLRARKPHPAHKTSSEPVATTSQTPPGPPPTLEQMPPSPPQVSYQNGELTIDSRNATLSDVLRSVQTKTGVSIDIPSGGGNERVAAQLGPGRPRDVLTTLLNGSKFNYVILGVEGNPGAVQKVVLTARQNIPMNAQGGGSPNPNGFAGANPMAGSPPYPPGAMPDDTSASQDVDPEAPPPDYNDAGPPADNSADQQPQTFPNAAPPENNALTPRSEAAQVVPGQNGVKTPEQLLQELQRMQQIQQQQQQQQQQQP